MTNNLTKEIPTSSRSPLRTLSNDTVLTREASWNYDYNHNKAKYMHFIDWGKENLVPKHGNHVTTRNLFEHYKSLTKEEALVTEDLYYKEIESIMFGLHLSPGRVKTKLGRGYQGIGFREQSRCGFG